jgi:aryl sulfotransferase
VSGIYWLASYPKSGNTWLRALLTNYSSDGDEPADINQLHGGGTAFLRETFDNLTGIESADLTPQQIERYRPLAYEHFAADHAEPPFLKIHDAYTCNADARPLFPERATAGVIYLVRNPLDVVISYAHHRARPVDDTIQFMSRHDAILAGSGISGTQLPQRLLSWSGHVRSWVDAPGLNRLVVRYEDMVRQPVETFAAIVRFAGLAGDRERLERAVEFSRFERLQSQEAAHGFAEKQPTAASFFRAGRAGAWRDCLSDAQVQRVVGDHHEVMHRFGYLPEADTDWVAKVSGRDTVRESCR